MTTPTIPSVSQVWQRVVGRLDHDPAAQLNTFHESCSRWATDRGRLALILRHPDARSERWTYSELARAAASTSAMFKSLGLRRGDRVASVLTRQVEAWIVALAAWRSGLVVVPLFVGFGADALRKRLQASRSKAVVVDHRWRTTVEEALEGLDHDAAVVTVAGEGGRGLRHGDWSFWSELELAGNIPDQVATKADEPATLMFTSGTTSEPKACILPHSGFLSLMPFVEHALALERDDLLFATSDPGWSYGLYTNGCAPMSLGIPRVLYTGDFDPQAWLAVIEAEQVTFATGAPTAFRQLLAAMRKHGFPSNLRGASTAGEPLDPDTVASWRALSGTDICDGYGQTEVGMVLANLVSPPTVIEAGWLASVVPGFEVELLGVDGQPVGPGSEGALAVKRPRFQLSIGYDNAPEAWDAHWHEDYFVTDDLFYRDERGRYRFSGRADDVIVTAGYNVGPAEIESVLLEHPRVLEAAAVAAADAARGSVVRAVVVVTGAPSAELTEALQNSVRERVGRHAYPRTIDYVDALPRTATGKVRRAALRAAETPTR